MNDITYSRASLDTSSHRDVLVISKRSSRSWWAHRGTHGGYRPDDDDDGDGDTAVDSRSPNRRSRRNRDSWRSASRNAAASFSNNRRKNTGPLLGRSCSATIPYCSPYYAARDATL